MQLSFARCGEGVVASEPGPSYLVAFAGGRGGWYNGAIGPMPRARGVVVLPEKLRESVQEVVDARRWACMG